MPESGLRSDMAERGEYDSRREAGHLRACLRALAVLASTLHNRTAPKITNEHTPTQNPYIYLAYGRLIAVFFRDTAFFELASVRVCDACHDDACDAAQLMPRGAK